MAKRGGFSYKSERAALGNDEICGAILRLDGQGGEEEALIEREKGLAFKRCQKAIVISATVAKPGAILACGKTGEEAKRALGENGDLLCAFKGGSDAVLIRTQHRFGGK